MKIARRIAPWIGIAALAACGGDDGGDRTSVATFPPPTTMSADGSGDGSGDDGDGSGDDGDGSGDDGDGSGDSTSAAPSTDDDTAGPPDELPACAFQCTTAADCTVDGDAIGLSCVSGYCLPGCTSADACVAFFSFWLLESCTASTDCGLGPCVMYEGGSGCAIDATMANCGDVGLQSIARTSVEGASVMVCGQPSAQCGSLDDLMSCYVPCTPTSCGALTCGANGRCQCTDDIQCYMQQVGERCDASGICRYACVSPADCPPSPFGGTTTVCE